MFDWIKKLTKGSTSAPPTVTRQIRATKTIIPASQRETEYVEETSIPAPLAVIRRVTQLVPAPSISLPPALPKSALPPPISMVPHEPEEEPLAAEPPHVVRLTAEPVRLGSPMRKPGIKLEMPGLSPATDHKEIVLCVSDFLERIPSHFVNENAVQPNQEIRFDAADLYSDMSKGRATVPLSIIAEALPSLFKRRLSSEEDIEISLPLPKIVAQMGDLLTRRDQEQPEAFDEVETPFLKAAQRDQEIHKISGAVAAPVPLAPLPPADFAPPSMPVISLKPRPTVLRIPEPAEPKLEISLPAPKLAAQPKTTNRRVTVRVRPLIQAMPMEQREALLGSIPEDCQVDLPLDEIEGQLSSGRVFLPLATFSAALNPAIRSKFNQSFVGSEVPISLSEIVKNLPTESFRLREDQLEQEIDPDEFETPFNTTPDSISTKPVTRAILGANPPPPSSFRPKTAALANYTTRKLNSAGNKFPSPMHAALGTQDPLDAKKVVKLASSLPGVASLTIITADGLSLADNLPSFMDPEGFSAMAPQLHRKMATHAMDMKLGELRHLSLTTDSHTITIFTGDGMTIAVLHQNQSDLGHGVREKFVAIVDGLAKQYGSELATR